MNSTPLRQRAAAPLLACIVVLAGLASAEPVHEQLPNLKPLPASDLLLVTDSRGRATLRFSTTSWNNGTGPLQLEAGQVDTGSGKQQVFQRIFLNNFEDSVLRLAGYFEWHADHNHFHFDNFALYTLQPVHAAGGSKRSGSKTTFCVMDTDKIDTQLPGAPAQPVYSSCGQMVQGLSVGWGDTYGSHLSGQEIDFTDNPDGLYQLKIELDPHTLISEADENDNVSCVLLDIRKPNQVKVMDSSGSCSTVASISPNTAQAGSSITVTIAGYGFTEGMTISFEGGNGPRPVASNIRLATDTDTLDTLTATVTVPAKKNLGRDPVWNVRVGGGILMDAFTVTR